MYISLFEQYELTQSFNTDYDLIADRSTKSEVIVNLYHKYKTIAFDNIKFDRGVNFAYLMYKIFEVHKNAINNESILWECIKTTWNPNSFLMDIQYCIVSDPKCSHEMLQYVIENHHNYSRSVVDVAKNVLGKLND